MHFFFLSLGEKRDKSVFSVHGHKKEKIYLFYAVVDMSKPAQYRFHVYLRVEIEYGEFSK